MKTSRRLIAYAALTVWCGALCASAAWAVYSRDLTGPADFGIGIFDKVDLYPGASGISLCRSFDTKPLLWVPSSADGTVSKIDGRTGQETGRYRMGPAQENWQPRAVATDSSGTAYVACRCPGLAGEIVRIASSGGMVTSVDRDGDGHISPTEMLPWGRDEAVLGAYKVGDVDSCPSSLAFDSNSNLWICLSQDSAVVKLDASTGMVLASVEVGGKPSSIVAGPRDHIFVLCSDSGTLSEIDPLMNVTSSVVQFGKCHPSGMCLGDSDGIWISSAQGLIEFYPGTGAWTAHPVQDSGQVTSVARDSQGDLWATCPSENCLVHIASDASEVVSKVPVGKQPGSVSADVDGYLWVLNQGSSSAVRVDPRVQKVVSVARTANSPLSSTPFTAYSSRSALSPTGAWSALFDAGFSGAGWGTLTWDADGSGALKVEVRTADDPAQLPLQLFQPVINGEQFSAANGRYLEVRTTFTGNTYTSPVLRDLRVEGVNLAPDVSKATPTLSRLSGRDGSFQEVGITGVTDPEGDAVTISIVKVTQDEPISGLGPDGKDDGLADAKGIGQDSVLLRAICNPPTEEKSANGRVYVVTFRATDTYGASTTGKVKVTVPPNDHAYAIAVDDGQRYDSTKRPNLDLVAKN